MKTDHSLPLPKVPAGYFVGNKEGIGLYEIYDSGRRNKNTNDHQIVARLFSSGKIVMWVPGESQGNSVAFKTYNDARMYLESCLFLGLIYENMPELFTRGK